MIARRRWEELPAHGWRVVLDDRLAPDPREAPLPDGRVPVLFNPECSALLVAALVKLLHTPGQERAVEVGSAWQLIDDSDEPDPADE